MPSEKISPEAQDYHALKRGRGRAYVNDADSVVPAAIELPAQMGLQDDLPSTLPLGPGEELISSDEDETRQILEEGASYLLDDDVISGQPPEQPGFGFVMPEFGVADEPLEMDPEEMEMTPEQEASLVSMVRTIVGMGPEEAKKQFDADLVDNVFGLPEEVLDQIMADASEESVEVVEEPVAIPLEEAQPVAQEPEEFEYPEMLEENIYETPMPAKAPALETLETPEGVDHGFYVVKYSHKTVSDLVTTDWVVIPKGNGGLLNKTELHKVGAAYAKYRDIETEAINHEEVLQLRAVIPEGYTEDQVERIIATFQAGQLKHRRGFGRLDTKMQEVADTFASMRNEKSEVVGYCEDCDPQEFADEAFTQKLQYITGLADAFTADGAIEFHGQKVSIHELLKQYEDALLAVVDPKAIKGMDTQVQVGQGTFGGRSMAAKVGYKPGQATQTLEHVVSAAQEARKELIKTYLESDPERKTVSEVISAMVSESIADSQDRGTVSSWDLTAVVDALGHTIAISDASYDLVEMTDKVVAAGITTREAVRAYVSSVEETMITGVLSDTRRGKLVVATSYTAGDMFTANHTPEPEPEPEVIFEAPKKKRKGIFGFFGGKS